MVTKFINNPNGSRAFEWGTAAAGFTTSRLDFVPTTFSGVQTGQYFSLGDLTYRNGEIYAGTEAKSVDLLTYLTFTSPNGITGTYNFDLTLINTVNTGDPVASADTVLLSAYTPTTFFTSGGVNYSLSVGLGTLSGFSSTNEFIVREGRSATTKIVGIVTAQTPSSVPDTSSTLALLGMAVVGLGGLRRYVTCKA
jgi:protein with PEP-CTERM/exosortase system signal